ncbi:MAG: hypothetical protein HC861_01920 [Rhodospirillaceae bacterium]|nr:hypothetical protein [Rhodospirillaceae bacterium]
MNPQDIDGTGIRRALVENAHLNRQEGAEGIYRAVAPLRDLLPTDAQVHLAALLEWAREGMSRQIEEEPTADLQAMHAACSYARDVLLEAVRRKSNGNGDGV